MTLSSEAIKTSVFDGNGSTTAFAFTFKTFLAADLVVTLTSTAGVETVKTLTTHYTISLNSNQDSDPGGSVTMVTAPASGSPAEKLIISNAPNYTQGVDLVSGGAFNANVIEDAIDRNTILARRAQELTTRSVQIPISDDTGTAVELPTETLRANKAVVFSSTGAVGVSVDNYVDQVATVAASATSASTSASSASTSATAAATSATAAAASYDSFDDRYLGTKSSDPSTDNDGATLVDGALYFNTSTNVMMVYDLGGTTWNRTTPTSADQTKINTVSGIASKVTTVAGISSNVTTVAGISSNVTTVAGISSDVTAVAGDATDIGAVAAKATEIGRLGTADAVTDMSILGTAAIVTDMSILGTAAVVEDMSILGTADIVTDMSILATSDIVTDMSILATSDIVTDMSILGTAAVVEDMSILGTAAVVEDMSILATPDIITDMSILATPAIVTDMSILGTAAIVEDMSILGTAAIVTDMSILATPAIVTDMSILGTAAIVEDLSILGTSGNVTAMATCATNIADVNNFFCDKPNRLLVFDISKDKPEKIMSFFSDIKFNINDWKHLGKRTET